MNCQSPVVHPPPSVEDRLARLESQMSAVAAALPSVIVELYSMQGVVAASLERLCDTLEGLADALSRDPGLEGWKESMRNAVAKGNVAVPLTPEMLDEQVEAYHGG